MFIIIDNIAEPDFCLSVAAILDFPLMGEIYIYIFFFRKMLLHDK